jgi:hypothetical protein
MTKWNIVRSSGSLIRIAGVIFFTTIMWKALVEKTSPLSVDNYSPEFSFRLPTRWHTFNEPVVICVN